MNKRIFELDLARIIIVLTLPFIHIMEFWGDMYGYADMISLNATSILNTICEILCIFVAPTFMVCMGINMSFTRKSTYKDFIRRGFILLAVELLLNIIRYEIPGLISLAVATSSEAKELVASSMRLGSINSDILALAGLAFIVFGLFKKFNFKPRTILIISTILYFIDLIINETIMPSLAVNMNFDLSNLLGNFIYIDENSTFPIMEWLMFISTGYCLGVKIKVQDEDARKTMFKKILIITVFVFAFCLSKAIMYEVNPIESLNKAGLARSMTPLCLIGEISASLLFLSLIYTIYNLLHLKSNDKFNNWAAMFSNNITYFYCVQWTIVGWGMMFGIALLLGSKALSMLGVLVCYVVICIISYYLGGWLHTKIKTFNLNKH